MKEQGGWRKRQKDSHLPEIPNILFLKYEHCPWYSEQRCQDFHDVWNLRGAHHLQTPASTKEYDNRFKEMWIIKTKTSKKRFTYCKFIFHADKWSIKVLQWKEWKLVYIFSFFFSPASKKRVTNDRLFSWARIEVKVNVLSVVHEVDWKPKKQTFFFKICISYKHILVNELHSQFSEILPILSRAHAADFDCLPNFWSARKFWS